MQAVTRSADVLQVVYLLVLFCVCVGRAASQSIAGDEAWMYERFLTGTFGDIFRSYDAANHFLFTYLSFFALKIFGQHDFVYRLPSLGGALAYMAGCLRLCNWAFPKRFWATLALIWLTLNPFILDFMVAARGYGLALGLFTWLLYCAARVITGESGNTKLLGYLAAFCIAANLSFFVPVVALVSLVVAVEVWVSRERLPTFGALMAEVVGTGAVILFVLTSISLTKAKAADFYYGSQTMAGSYRRLFEVALEYRPSVFSFSAVGQALTFIARWCGRNVLWVLCATVPGIAMAAQHAMQRKANHAQSLLLLSAGVLGLSILLLLVGHRLTGVLYPLDRTGIYFFPLIGFCVAAAGASLRGRAGLWAGSVLAAILGLQVLVFAGEWNTRYFYLWQYDAHADRIAELIGPRYDEQTGRKVQVGATYLNVAALNYYIRLKKLTWIAPVYETPVDRFYDVYVLSRDDRALVQKRGLRVLYRDNLSGVVLARPTDSTDVPQLREPVRVR